MRFIRCFTLAILFAALAPSFVPGSTFAPQAVSAQTTSQPPQTTPANLNRQPAYSLPPDKLAKAIALSRIRNTMDIVNGLWGIAVIWLLLATGIAARLELWIQGLSSKRWIAGLQFFSAFFLITTLASLPLAWFGQHIEKAYDISVQPWGSWLGDQGKGLVLTLGIGAPILLLFNWIVRRGPAATGLAHGSSPCRCSS